MSLSADGAARNFARARAVSPEVDTTGGLPMKAVALIGATILSVSGALLVTGAASAAESRTKEQCSQLFHHLNASGTGKLTLNEVAGDMAIAKALDDPYVWRNGYVTEDEFTPLCMGGSKDKSQTPQ
jgi:hypothetical protein